MAGLLERLVEVVREDLRRAPGVSPLTVPPNTFCWFAYGVSELLKNAVYRSYQTNWKLRLYQNSYTPAPGDDGTSITECTYPGYSAQVLQSPWGQISLSGYVAQSSNAQMSFTAGSTLSVPQTVYGWYMTDTGNSDKPLGACLLPSSILVNTPQQVIQVTPTITLQTRGS